MRAAGCGGREAVGRAMTELTARQERVVRFIQRTVRRTRRAPTYREIASHLGVDVRAAFQHVVALERKGVLERSAGHIELAGGFAPPEGIPLIGRVAAGSPILAAENCSEYLDIASRLDEEDLFLLRVVGDSMVDAGINDGDMVLARSQPTVDNGSVAVVVIGDEATVKRVRVTSKKVILEPANSRYKPMVFDRGGEEVTIAGEVLMAIRML